MCIADIKSWAIANKLKFNDSKTEIIHFTSKYRTSHPLPPIKVGDTVVNAISKSRNLGVIFDSHRELKDHVSKVVQSAWVGVRKVGHLRKFLNPLSSDKLVHAFITSHLDYCNSLLSGLPDKDISRLQRIQNASARIIKCAKRSDSISRLLQDLHWLPVHLRVKFKILLTMYKCVNGSAPDYLCELISSYTPARRLRSLSQSLAVQPKVASKTYGESSFSFMGPFL